MLQSHLRLLVALSLFFLSTSTFALTLPANLEKNRILSDSRFEEDRYVLQVQLGRLNPSTFQSVLEKTKIANSVQLKRPQFDSNRSYTLNDFLPPMAQATVNRNMTVVADEVEVSLDKALDRGWRTIEKQDSNGQYRSFVRVSSYANCWGASWEFLRTAFSPQANPLEFGTFWLGRYEADQFLSDRENQYSIPVNSRQTQYGDLIVIRFKENGSDVPILIHTAIFLGTFGNQRVVYEKVDSFKDTPFRLSLEQDVFSKYQKLAKAAGSQLEIQYRRFSQTRLALPDPAQFVMEKQQPGSSSVFKNAKYGSVVIEACDLGLGGGCSLELNYWQNQKTVFQSSGYVLDPNRSNSRRFPLVPFQR